ncbi:glycosyltransferase family 2 protein [Geomesophilobacter sediminis]|uniref:Glycosyltransferase n=1 Tax=Geomesophilobacter sediminis TaxID=2798584 RepID=A0A8J7LU16_9BACT|nr:glycosyltransferase family 2 protein [Geomesophilobacter sediminis]MBJ6724079.1 glycosyltransferase [Geomesophilobacter sediminis]
MQTSPKEPNTVAKRFSVVTVCRNSAETVRQTVESVLAEIRAQDEYLVIDGGSTDGTLDILRSFGSGIDQLISEPDGGIADAFNKGIRLAKGEIIALVNSDDRLLPGAFRRVAEFYEAHPKVDVVHGDVLLHEAGCVKRLKPSGCWWYPWRLVLFNHPATFVRRSVYEAHGLFDPTLSIAMDVDIFLRWSRAGVAIAYLAEPLVAMHAGGVSGRCATEGFRQARDLFIRHGYSPILAQLQYAGKCSIQILLNLSKGRQLREVSKACPRGGLHER